LKFLGLFFEDIGPSKWRQYSWAILFTSSSKIRGVHLELELFPLQFRLLPLNNFTEIKWQAVESEDGPYIN